MECTVNRLTVFNIKILITGASGFIGGRLFALFSEDIEVVGTYNEHEVEGLVQLDVTDRQATEKLIHDLQPDIVIHTVALTDPDTCEQRRDEAYAKNFVGARNVVAACRQTGARLFYISTVYVFDGEKGNYIETDETNPINWYGQTKRAAEQEVQTMADHTIFRFDIVYGYNGEGRANGLMDKITAGVKIEINFDQIRQPLFVDDIATMIRLVASTGESGIFHLAGPDTAGKFDLARRLEQIVRPDTDSLLIPIPEKQQVARRPKDVSIITDRARALGMKFTAIDEAMRQIEGQYIQSVEGTMTPRERKS